LASQHKSGWGELVSLISMADDIDSMNSKGAVFVEEPGSVKWVCFT
jgi:hypothetical protein